MTNTTPDAGRASVPDPRPDAVEPQMGTGSAAASNPIPAIERNVDHTELEPGDTDTDPISPRSPSRSRRPSISPKSNLPTNSPNPSSP